MKLKILNSNSAGNAYLLGNDQEALLIECGIRWQLIKQAMNFNLRRVVGCLVSHNHQDHCKAAKDVLAAGLEVYASRGTHEAIGTIIHHRAMVLSAGKEQGIGGFRVLPFDVKHDAAEPLGFMISHRETGNILFLTDSYYVEYTFRDLHNVIIEANYESEILDQRLSTGSTPGFLRDRVIQSHMSLDTCKKTLMANDLSRVINIVLIHLSDSNSNARRFKREVEEETGKRVWISQPGMEICLDKNLY
jgi:phosphoribosyl 1,2-cyclic phosphodiesterase